MTHSTKERIGAAMDDLTALQIELAAVRACCDRSDYDPMRAPGEQMSDNDYRAGIREVFADEPDFEDWMVEPLLAQVRQAIRDREEATDICHLMLADIFGRAG